MADSNHSFSSNIGAIMAAVGSAVGLGNIWRFPYICGKYGGGAFLLVYIFFVFVIGMMLMVTEFVVGRRSQSTPPKAYETLSPRHRHWRLVGILGVVTCFFILSQYIVISGWTLHYFAGSCVGKVASLGVEAAVINDYFEAFSSSAWLPVVCLVAFAVITAVVVTGGVQRGIERVSRVLMPFLVVIVLLLCVRSLTLPGASKGLAYLFRPDFSLLTREGVMAALGQALFSLSVGMGAMVVYGSYLPKNDDIFKTSLWITACDTLIAVLAGVAIFPAVFAYGLEPAGGPGLVFKTLPAVFNGMGGWGSFFSATFFLLLIVAAITSAISLLECVTATLCDSFRRRRGVSTLFVTVASIALGILLSLSIAPSRGIRLGGITLFDFVDSLNSIYLPPLCALGSVIFVGWVLPSEAARDELSSGGRHAIPLYGVYRFVVRYVAPVALIITMFV